MTTYSLVNLIISSFIALGTCGATILALYFWLNDKGVKLKIRNMHADTYGGLALEENGYFVVILTNIGARRITIETAGLVSFRRNWFKKPIVALHLFENTQFGSLPVNLEYGESYICCYS